MKDCYNKSASDVKFICSGLGVIIGWWIGVIKLKVLARSVVILVDKNVKFIGVDADINDYCFLLFIVFVFASIDGVSCGGMGKSSSDSKITHAFDVRYILLYL